MMDSRTLEYPIVRTEEPRMARGVDRTVLVVSALAAFFATLFAVLLLLEPTPSPVAAVVPTPFAPVQPAVAAPELPQVSAAPPSGPTAVSSVESEVPEAIPAPASYQAIRETLEQLGVECRGGDCFPE